jgi:hypothetical protein
MSLLINSKLINSGKQENLLIHKREESESDKSG